VMAVAAPAPPNPTTTTSASASHFGGSQGRCTITYSSAGRKPLGTTQAPFPAAVVSPF